MALERDYEVVSGLGEGAFGKVYKARQRSTGETVAVKQIKLVAKSWQEACRSTELQALRVLRHPYIVRLRELLRSQDDGSLYYIFEYIDSDLLRFVKAHPDGASECQACALSRQLLTGLAHIHQHGFFHRDIKPENILLNPEQGTIRIADFGASRSLRARPPFTDYVGTRWYRAPECLLGTRTYSSPVDVWAAGLVFAELLRGSPLFTGQSSIDQLHRIFNVLGWPDPSPNGDWPEYAAMVEGMAVRLKTPMHGNGAGCGIDRVLIKASPAVHAVLTDMLLVMNPRRRAGARRCMEHAVFSECAMNLQLGFVVGAGVSNDYSDGHPSEGIVRPLSLRAPPEVKQALLRESENEAEEWTPRERGSYANSEHSPDGRPVNRPSSIADPLDGRPFNRPSSIVDPADDLDIDDELDKILGGEDKSPARRRRSAGVYSPLGKDPIPAVEAVDDLLQSLTRLGAADQRP
mmetsp:Transcript_49448/g.117647  ORF Transcript_49448/g.117647 Transcript_49448/m.117647 type:complete len:463 (+) Transcript_49448:84-1472(+)